MSWNLNEAVQYYKTQGAPGDQNALTGLLREVQEVPPRDRAGEYLMMRLRTSMGIEPEEYERKFLLPFAPLEAALETFRQRKLAARTYDGRWHLTPQGFLLSNSIISDLLIIQEQCESITKRRN